MIKRVGGGQKQESDEHSTKPISVVVLDNGLASQSGHNYGQTVTLCKRLSSEGISCHVYGHKSCEPNSSWEIEPKPVFSKSLYEKCTEADRSQVAHKLKEEIIRVLHSHPDSIVYSPNSYSIEIEVIRDLLLLGVIKQEKCIVRILFSDNTNASEESYRYLNTVVYIQENFPRCKFITDSRAAQEALHECHITSHYLPQPMDINLGSLSWEPVYDFCYLGTFKPEKGALKLLSALNKGVQVGFSPKVLFQVQRIGKSGLEELQSQLPNVTFIDGDLSTSDYCNLMSQAESVITYYHPNSYALATSSVVIEALYLGRRLITSQFDFVLDLIDDFQLRQELGIVHNNSWDENDLLMKLIAAKSARYISRNWQGLYDKIRRRYSTVAFASQFLSEVRQ